ncbi:MAG: DUF4382 domain-containing protein [Bacteroidota bacterium]
MRKINVVVGLIGVIFMISSCKKDSDSIGTNKTFNVRMTDAPAAYGAVNIDLQSVEIVGDDDKTVVMNVSKGIYNLLDFTNGKDTLIATASLDAESVKQIRLILGSNNTIMVNGVSYPLSTPSAEQSGLKLLVNQTLEAGIANSITVDFDASKSIVEQGNGVYKLKPVLRTFQTAISGSIKGKISPLGTLASVTATSSTNVTYTTTANLLGDFMLVGVPSGMYTITVTPALPLTPFTQTNVVVTTGVVTNIGVVNF